MTNQIARLWTVVVGVVVFFLAWAAIAAHPWQTATSIDPRLSALAARQQVLQREAVQVDRIVKRRFAAYRAALAQRRLAITRANIAAAASASQAQAHAQAQAVSAPVYAPSATPPARVVTLPPLVITRTS
jgi:hypothetical protein